jgi:alkaline phosphatase
MKKALLFLFLFPAYSLVAQQYTPASVFAHNDYAKPNPFYNAYDKRVGYIEADIFLDGNSLYVAHVKSEIRNERTLEALYLTPLQKMILKNKGWAYPDSTMKLTLMIDLKTAGMSTIKKLAEQLKSYPELLTCPSLEIVISGNVPLPSLWDSIPSFIYMDGRPENFYTPEQLKRVSLISTNFNAHVKWRGRDTLPEKDGVVIRALVNEVHRKGKKIRFWATPDVENGWQALMNLNVDVIGTDTVDQLIEFLK